MSENINNEIQIERIIPPMVDDDPTEKKRGRKSVTGLYIKDNSEYFNQYYHLKGAEEITCECGALVKHACLTRHKKRAIHTKRMENLILA
jgi:hypothetical protein